MLNKVEKWIWNKKALPILKIPILLPVELGLNLEIEGAFSIEPDYHIYKPTGRKYVLNNGYEYEYEYSSSTKI